MGSVEMQGAIRLLPWKGRSFHLPVLVAPALEPGLGRIATAWVVPIIRMARAPDPLFPEPARRDAASAAVQPHLRIEPEARYREEDQREPAKDRQHRPDRAEAFARMEMV